MLRSLHELEGAAIQATDGEIGHVKDFYFDDRFWVLRYLVVETGSWLSSRKVLISPMSLGTPQWPGRQIPVRATQAQVRDSPSIDLARPVSRQYELQYGEYYGHPAYWSGGNLWGADMVPGMFGAAPRDAPTDADIRAESAYRAAYAERHGGSDQHLRSYQEIRGYGAHASDGDVGSLNDVLIDDHNWAIRYLVVDTGSWWQEHRVLLIPQWIERISWGGRELFIDQTRQELRGAPEYDPAVPPDREAELRLHAHYRRAGYWASPRFETQHAHID